jgi:NTP pyrophosphatase (non-canonical NTP hydrolase)
MELANLQQRAIAVRQRYAALEAAKYGQAWTREDVAMGLVGDVGDLAKLVMAKRGLRTMSNADERIAHELADCFWSIMVLAHLYGVDLEAAFLRTMDEILRHIEGELAGRREGEGRADA